MDGNQVFVQPDILFGWRAVLDWTSELATVAQVFFTYQQTPFFGIPESVDIPHMCVRGSWWKRE